MFRNIPSVLFIALAVLTLASFRMPAGDGKDGGMVYDIRGAFVTVGEEIDPRLARTVEQHLKAAIRATERSESLPRVVVSVRIDELKRDDSFFGPRIRARFTVKAAAVNSGAVIAVGVYSARSRSDRSLAHRISRAAARALSLEAPADLSLGQALEAAFMP